jgi:hypothetical protein
MSRFHCLLCDTCFDPPANHFCARECHPPGRHLDFCRRCRSASLKTFEAQLADVAAAERREEGPPRSRAWAWRNPRLPR